MENFTRQIIFGQRPVRRSDPKPGESEWYYFDPRGASTFDEMKTIDVPSENSPNPLKDEIQNDLYANDEYNYKQLFGDTPPPMQMRSSVQSRYWESAADGKQVYDNVVKQEGNFMPTNQNLFDYTTSVIGGGADMVGNFFGLRKKGVTDKYKHAYINCRAAQYGQGGADIATLASNLREWNDKRTGSNTLDSSEGDQYANKIGRLLGGKYPEGDCDELVQRYIEKRR